MIIAKTMFSWWTITTNTADLIKYKHFRCDFHHHQKMQTLEKLDKASIERCVWIQDKYSCQVQNLFEIVLLRIFLLDDSFLLQIVADFAMT